MSDGISGGGLSEVKKCDVDMCAMQHVSEWCALDELSPADLSQLSQMDLHTKLLKIAVYQLLESSHGRQHLRIHRAINDHRLSFEQVQSLQLVTGQSCQSPYPTVSQEVVVKVQCLQLRPLGFGEDGCRVISKLIVGEKKLVEVGKWHAGKSGCGSVIDGVTEQTEYLQASPLSALETQQALTSQTVETQVQLLQLAPGSLPKRIHCLSIEPIVTQVYFSQFRQFGPSKGVNTPPFDGIIAKRQESEIAPISLCKLKCLLISHIAKIKMDEFHIIRLTKKSCHFTESLHVNDIELGVQVVVLVELVDDAVFRGVVGELQRDLPSHLHPPHVLQRLLNCTLL